MSDPTVALYARPIRVGGITLPNRIVVTAHTYGLIDGTPDGYSAMFAYVAERLRGGVGAVVMGETLVTTGRAGGGDVGWGAAESGDDLSRLYERLASLNEVTTGVVVEQLFNPGGQVWHEENTVAYAPSSVPQARSYVVPASLGLRDIGDLVKSFGTAARRVARSGLGGVELKCDQGKLHHQFLSGKYNLRADAYGGDAQRRLRFVLECLEEMRGVTEGCVLGIRLPGWGVPSNISNAADLRDGEWVECLQVLASSGLIDYVSISPESNSTAWGYWQGHPDEALPTAPSREVGKLAKGLINIPILLAGNVLSLDAANEILEEGACDLVAMTRAHIAEPRFLVQTASGLADQVRPCISCNQGCIGNTWYGRPVRCTLNPRTGRELLPLPIMINRPVKPRVLVVGGGPSGMQFAQIAAERSCDVTLVERTGILGGEMLLAAQLPFRDRFKLGAAFLSDCVTRAGVDVKLGRVADQELVSGGNWDIVVCAIGAVPQLPAPFNDMASVYDYAEAVDAKDWSGRKALVVDGERYRDALGVVELVQARGGYVECVATPYDSVGLGLDPVTLTSRMSRLLQSKVPFHTWSEVISYKRGDVGLLNQISNEVTYIHDVDALIFVTNPIPAQVIISDIRQWSVDAGASFRVIGDALAPRGLLKAIHEGYDEAREMMVGGRYG